jgi:hypothetical protein
VFKIINAVLMVLLGSAVAAAQEPRSADQNAAEARRQRVMFEGMLRQAVETGAGAVARQMGIKLPPSLMLNGPADAFGFPLEDSGFVFHVAVPTMRQFTAFTLRAMAGRQSQMVRSVGAANVVPPLPPQPAPYVDQAVNDLDAFYTLEVKNAIIDSMIQKSAALRIGPDKWLTVSARDNAQPDPTLPSSYTEFNTVVFRIKGSDLAAFHDKRITLDDARKLVTMHEE